MFQSPYLQYVPPVTQQTDHMGAFHTNICSFRQGGLLSWLKGNTGDPLCLEILLSMSLFAVPRWWCCIISQWENYCHYLIMTLVTHIYRYSHWFASIWRQYHNISHLRPICFKNSRDTIQQHFSLLWPEDGGHNLCHDHRSVFEKFRDYRQSYLWLSSIIKWTDR